MKCNPLTQGLCLWVLQNSGRGGEIEQMNWLLSPRLIFISLLLQPMLPARISSLKSRHQWRGVLLIRSWTHSHMQKPSWNALTHLQSSLSCLACIHQHNDLSYLRTPKTTLMRDMGNAEGRELSASIHVCGSTLCRDGCRDSKCDNTRLSGLGQVQSW